jgi:hypothetical protein
VKREMRIDSGASLQGRARTYFTTKPATLPRSRASKKFSDHAGKQVNR